MPAATLDAGRRRASRVRPRASTVNPKLERQLAARGADARRRTRSTGRSPRRWRSARSCSRARRCASPARTRGAARSASATACSSTRPAKRSTCRSRTSPTTRRRSCSTTPCCRSTPRSGSSTATRSRSDALGVLGSAVRRLRQRARRSIIDQFIVAAADKWGQRSSLAAAPAARLRGPGPGALERPHRALPHAVAPRATCASCTRTTAAQYFHVLRRQAVSAAARAAGVLHAEALPAHAARRARRSPTFTDGAF